MLHNLRYSNRLGLLLVLGLLLLVLGGALLWWVRLLPPTTTPVFGVTFSTVQSNYLGINVRQVYLAMIDELQVKRVRLPVYWSSVEQERRSYSWEELDWLIHTAEEKGVELIPVVGRKVPRWPECFTPDWLQAYSEAEREQELMVFIEEVVNRYKDSPAIIRWQVENEPFLSFGECPAPNLLELQREIELVRHLDDRPIQLTASGELETWIPEAALADVLGVSIYRKTWNPLLGYLTYPFAPWVYATKRHVIEPLAEKVVVSELQAEPWFPEGVDGRSYEEWYEEFTAEDLRSNIQFARRARFPEVYLWGVEWWYLLKQEGDVRLWNEAKQIFSVL